ncbi:carboxylating nicotinate-nucleotide diphosphorylase [Candidatus Bathyarchaeota archaeon]|nr:carboxylating nicotinate-nucleotide diphosphorylase [Candidatus Bathyarchaeota archaeon]
MREKLRNFLEEDIGLGDITTEAIIPSGIKVHAQIVVKEPAVVAGLNEAKMIFEIVGAKFLPNVREGEEVQPGTSIAEVEGDGRSILLAERTALNLLSRMSGIATETRKLVRKVRDAGLNVRIAATRKTAPGLRYFDKRAVIIGGGDPHRFRLDDQILIKDNHIAIAGSLEEALKRALSYASFSKKIEVEAKTVDDAIRAAELGADIIMLDNMSVKEVQKVINSLRELGFRDKVLIEVSGEITENNILDYARTGPDIISVGAITHSVKSIDMSLEVIKVER